MKFVKRQSTSRGINADTKGVNIDSLGLTTINTDKSIFESMTLSEKFLQIFSNSIALSIGRIYFVFKEIWVEFFK